MQPTTCITLGRVTRPPRIGSLRCAFDRPFKMNLATSSHHRFALHGVLRVSRCGHSLAWACEGRFGRGPPVLGRRAGCRDADDVQAEYVGPIRAREHATAHARAPSRVTAPRVEFGRDDKQLTGNMPGGEIVRELTTGPAPTTNHHTCPIEVMCKNSRMFLEK